VEVTRMVLSDWTSHYPEPDFYNWAIVLKENGPEPIGNISVVYVKERTLCATIGYCMSRAHWGKGIMAEALTALIAFLFDEVGFNRIEAYHDIENPNSGRVMQKAGMQFEGTARQGGRTNRGIVDICHWAILRSDR
jgi:ribosomal-protein-alanine N-acetyltransferase